MASLGKLLVEIAADTASFKSDMGRAARVMEQQSRRIEQSGKRMDRMFVGLKKSVASFAAGFVGVVGVRGVAGAFQQVAANAQALEQVTRNLNISVDQFQKLQIAADFAGVSTQQLEKGLQRMVRRLSEAASGTGEAQNALKELGVDVERLEKLDAAETFTILTDELLKSETAADSLRIAFKLFDAEFAQGALNVAAAAKEVGNQFDAMILTKEQNANLARMQVVFDKIKVSIRLVTAQVVNFLTQWRELLKFVPGPAGFAARFFFDEDTIKSVNDDIADTVETIKQLGARLAELETEGISEGFRVDKVNRELAVTLRTLNELAKRRDELTPGSRINPIGIKGTLLNDAPIGGGGAPIRLPDIGPTVSGPLGTFDADIDEATQLLEARLSPALDEAREKTNQLQRGATSAGRAFTNALRPSTVAANTLAESLENVAIRLADILFQFSVADPLAQSLGGLFSAPAGPVVSPESAARLLNAQPRAFGGPITAGDAYLVGERGPELFVSGKSGRIVPGEDIGGTNVTFNINAMDSQSVLSAIAQHERQIVGMVRKGYARRGKRADL